MFDTQFRNKMRNNNQIHHDVDGRDGDNLFGLEMKTKYVCVYASSS